MIETRATDVRAVHPALANRTPTHPSRGVPFLVYLIPVLGWLVGLTVLRRNVAAFYHACQALALMLGLLLVPLLWAVLGWIVAWIPLVGPVLAVASFALVIAAGMAGIVAWIVGMVNALRGYLAPIPFFGGLGERIFMRLARPITVDTPVDYRQQGLSNP